MKALCRAQTSERMFAKLLSPRFLLDLRPLKSATQVEQMTDEFSMAFFRSVFTVLAGRQTTIKTSMADLPVL